MKVDFVDLKLQYEDVLPLVYKELEDVISKGAFVGSNQFEEKLASFIGTKYCVGVGSGTDALWFSLVACGIGPGDEVIVPSNTYIATAFAVSHAGATPVFVDPDPKTYVLDTDLLERVVGPKTRAIMPVHLYGHPVNMPKLMEFAESYSLRVIEDCAQSIGAEYGRVKTGAFGDTGCFSFYPTKNLGGLGQGGAVVTDDEGIARVVRELGNVGREEGSWFKYAHKGFNSRLDAVNAKFLEVCLDYLPLWNLKRRTIADLYHYYLKGCHPINLPPMKSREEDPVFHLFEIKCTEKLERDRLKVFLENKGISCSLHYPIPCHRQPVYGAEFKPCPVSDILSDTLLSLPMHPELSSDEVKYICDRIKDYYEI